MIYRQLGATGETISVVGFGGILCTGTTPAESAAIVGEAIDAGVTYFDVAPTYGDAEEKLGPALEPYRDKVFLACKTTRRDRDGAALELRQSLGRLKTDHFDLYQLHSMTTQEDIDQTFGPGGAAEELIEARRLGLVRHLGFSAHSEEAALACLERFEFDSVLFPTNYIIATQGNFGPRVFEAVRRRGIGFLALKALGLGLWLEGEQRGWSKCWYQPTDQADLASISLRWTLNQGVHGAPTPGHPELFRLAVAAVADGEAPMPSEEELAYLTTSLGERKPIFSV